MNESLPVWNMISGRGGLKIVLLCSVITLSACGGGGGSSGDSDDNSGGTDPVPASNNSPVAMAGTDQVVEASTVVQLRGAGTDSDGEVVRYRWRQTAGETVQLRNSDQSQAQFTAPSTDTSQRLEFELTVFDDDGASSTDRVNVTVSATENQPPSGFAGDDRSVDSGEYVVLNGSSSDPDGVVVRHQWRQVSGPSVELRNANSSLAEFDAPLLSEQMQLAFEYTVTDDRGSSQSSFVTITVRPVPPNEAPTADAGSDQSAREGARVNLLGSGSDVDGSVVSFQWRQTAGTQVEIENADQPQASFTAPAAGLLTQLEFELTVIDDDGASGSDVTAVSVSGNVPLGQVTLNTSLCGPLLGADVFLYDYSSLDGAPIFSTTTDRESGTFTVEQNTFESQGLYVAVVANGTDDCDDGVEANSGSLSALLPGELIENNVTTINALTHASYQYLRYAAAANYPADKIIEQLISVSQRMLGKDLDDSGEIDYRDVLSWAASENSGDTKRDYQENWRPVVNELRDGNEVFSRWLVLARERVGTVKADNINFSGVRVRDDLTYISTSKGYRTFDTSTAPFPEFIGVSNEDESISGSLAMDERIVLARDSIGYPVSYSHELAGQGKPGGRGFGGRGLSGAGYGLGTDSIIVGYNDTNRPNVRYARYKQNSFGSYEFEFTGVLSPDSAFVFAMHNTAFSIRAANQGGFQTMSLLATRASNPTPSFHSRRDVQFSSYAWESVTGVLVGRRIDEATAGFAIYDLSNPSSPQLIFNPRGSEFAQLGDMFDVSLQAGKMIIRGNSIYEFDVSDPAVPVLLSTSPVDENHRIRDIFNDDGLLYLVYDDVVRDDYMDIRQIPASPNNLLISEYPGAEGRPVASRDFDVAGESVYAVHGEEGLSVIDLSQPQTPGITGRFNDGADQRLVSTDNAGDVIAVAELDESGSAALSLLVSNADGQPARAGATGFVGAKLPFDLNQVNGNTLATSENRLDVYDSQNAASPVFFTSATANSSVGELTAVLVDGDRFLTGSTQRGVQFGHGLNDGVPTFVPTNDTATAVFDVAAEQSIGVSCGDTLRTISFSGSGDFVLDEDEFAPCSGIVALAEDVLLTVSANGAFINAHSVDSEGKLHHFGQVERYGSITAAKRIGDHIALGFADRPLEVFRAPVRDVP